MANSDRPTREVGKRISKIRRLRGYSEEYMAQRLGVSQRQYSRYETGESTLAPEKLTVVCEVLEVEQEDLLNFDERLVFNHCHQANTFGPGNASYEGGTALIEQLREQVRHHQDEITYLRKQLEASIAGKKP